MRCKKHLIDFSSNIGVCASCLRERLFALIAAQAQEDRRKSEPQPPPLVFPRSVSPYVSRRQSDNENHHRRFHHSLSDQRFFGTPQVGPTGAVVTGSECKKKSRFSVFSRLFRSKSKKAGMDPRVSVSNSQDPCTASSSSPSWFATMLSGNRKKKSRLFSLDESTAGGGRRKARYRDRGMSPVRGSDGADEEECCDGSSGYSSEASRGWKQTPRKVEQPARRSGGRPSHSPNVSGFTFCLSPMVRASPSRQWNQKAMPPETAFSGEIRIPAKPRLSNAASFCANRSRKLADFGRFNHNH